MLLLAGILLSIIGLGMLLMIGFANGMSDSPSSHISLLPAWLILLLAVTCFVARHFLHGQAITW